MFMRATDVLWRLGGDRVVARRIGGDGIDLLGPTALVWIALDSPRASNELCDDLAEFDIGTEMIEVALQQLLRFELVCRLA